MKHIAKARAYWREYVDKYYSNYKEIDIASKICGFKNVELIWGISLNSEM